MRAIVLVETGACVSGRHDDFMWNMCGMCGMCVAVGQDKAADKMGS